MGNSGFMDIVVFADLVVVSRVSGPATSISDVFELAGARLYTSEMAVLGDADFFVAFFNLKC